MHVFVQRKLWRDFPPKDNSSGSRPLVSMFISQSLSLLYVEVGQILQPLDTVRKLRQEVSSQDQTFQHR